MKAGLTIEELAAEIMRQKDAKTDYIVNSSRLCMENYGTDLVLRVLGDDDTDRIEPLDIADTAHRQIGTRLGIPAKYYGKMLSEHPDLLVTNVNAWFSREPTERMLRVLDGKVRAYLSNSYMRMDHYEIFASVLPVIGEIPDVQFVSCHITDSRMYIKAVYPNMASEISPGDTVKMGVVISNSEVGLGSVSVQPLIYRELNGNGIVVGGATTKRIHRGRVNSAEEHFMLASQEVLTEADRTFLTELQETVRSATDEEQFSQIVALMQTARNQPMNTTDIPAVVHTASRVFGVTDTEQTGVLQHLMESNDLSLYGLANAVTRHSQDIESYDRATDLEGIGYNILSMPQRQWNRINQIAA
ncbi:DUF932 domain-containing protein [Massiliimalia timonensis]|uniref:DUF932 domain-containing protein n=1 Tax=Massiliimalia timonensis TaxID=1987501 RepID=UPI00189FC11C|nr:DUF932 domain-containing protein [Massiliimalia timonensis]